MAGADGWIHIPEPVDVRRFELESSVAAASFKQRFEQRREAELTVYAIRGMFTPADLDELIVQRSRTMAELSRLLGVNAPPGVRLVFYPNAESKVADTHHVGAGMTSGTTIVEVRSDSVRLDPYHELAHVMAGQLGCPPAWLNEGFAAYASELLGADALAQLGSPGKTVDEASCANHRRGDLFSMDELMRLSDIGPAETRPSVAYALSASLTRFIADEFGLDALRRAFRTLSVTASPAGNELAFAQVFGMSSGAAGERWLQRIESTFP